MPREDHDVLERDLFDHDQPFQLGREQLPDIPLPFDDICAFGALMSASHRSSIENFENSCEEIDDLVALGSALPGFLGARISGGGFGGISVHLVRAEAADEYAQRLAAAYKAKRGIDAQVMICSAADGAALYDA